MRKERFDVVVPPIRDDESGYKYLSKLSNYILSNPDPFYIFDFSKCSVISHNGLVVIGGICNYLNQHETKTRMLKGFGISSIFASKKVGFKIDGISQILMERLCDLGFWNYAQ